MYLYKANEQFNFTVFKRRNKEFSKFSSFFFSLPPFYFPPLIVMMLFTKFNVPDYSAGVSAGASVASSAVP